MPGLEIRDLGSIEPMRATADPGFRFDTARRGTMYFVSVAPFSALAVVGCHGDGVPRLARKPWGASLHLKYVPSRHLQGWAQRSGAEEGALPWGHPWGPPPPV